jgi:uracil-DNA glycosylase family 4
VAPSRTAALASIQRRIAGCTRCPRLVAWRERVALEPPRRHLDERYWARAVPSFGDPRARLVLVGLAPAAHGANRTGRMFTGDRSGEWLYRALHRAGFANRPDSLHVGDGLTLRDCWITAAVHCAPPANRPTPGEIGACRPFLQQELAQLTEAKVVVGLGRIGFDAAATALQEAGLIRFERRPAFGHGHEHALGRVTLLGCYHPSQQNTFTGRLTEGMLDAVLARASALLRSRAGGRP